MERGGRAIFDQHASAAGARSHFALDFWRGGRGLGFSVLAGVGADSDWAGLAGVEDVARESAASQAGALCVLRL